jgi:sporulation protein YlmC with PRC-barrel domain
MISKSQLINLPVRTQSDDHLGHVTDVEINEQSKEIEKIEVKSGKIFHLNTFLIDKEQIVKITKHEVIVKDTLIKEKQLLRRNLGIENTAPAPAINCEREG